VEVVLAQHAAPHHDPHIRPPATNLVDDLDVARSVAEAVRRNVPNDGHGISDFRFQI
jgi:hypothetical protein